MEICLMILHTITYKFELLLPFTNNRDSGICFKTRIKEYISAIKTHRLTKRLNRSKMAIFFSGTHEYLFLGCMSWRRF